jgi:hypothetical protein
MPPAYDARQKRKSRRALRRGDHRVKPNPKLTAISVRATTDQRILLRRAAKRLGYSVGSLLRHSALITALRTLGYDDLASQLAASSPDGRLRDTDAILKDAVKWSQIAASKLDAKPDSIGDEIDPELCWGSDPAEWFR